MILTVFLVRTQETIQISLSEDTFMILAVFLVRTQEIIQTSLSEETFMIFSCPDQLQKSSCLSVGW